MTSRQDHGDGDDDGGGIVDAIPEETRVVVSSSRHRAPKLEEVDPGGALEPGDVAGSYVISRRIATGGCGTVYAAVHRVLGRTVALKVLHRHLVGVARFLDRFVQEARAVNLIRHPGIVDIHEIGALDDGTPFYVMELVDGVSLATLLEERGGLSPLEASQILEPVCDALQAAHDKGIIHRDVKASNVIVVEGGAPAWRVKLVDFGIAKVLHADPGERGITVVGQRLGTPHYMAPEQFRAEPVDARTDVYALGVLLFRMLTAELPFHAHDLGEIERMHLEAPPPPPSERVPVAAAVDAVVLRAMAKDPAHRFPSVAAFQAALHRAVFPAATERIEPVAARAVGIYAELRVPELEGELDDALLWDIANILDLAARRLEEAGFGLALQTGTAVLGTRVASDGAPGEVLSHGLRVANDLFDALASRPGADGRIRFNVCLHVDDVTMQVAPNGAGFVAGPLLQTARWAPEPEMSMVCVTEEVTRELPAIEQECSGRYILVRKRAGGGAS